MHPLLPQILPTKGLYCSGQLRPSGGYTNKFHNTVEEMMQYMAGMDMAGGTMYFAQATFRTQESRKTDNAQFVRNFFFDVDCGEAKFEATPDKAYRTQYEGLTAIKEFAAYMNLPVPSIVNSGNGLYSHWAITEDIPADKWKSLASILKQVAYKAGFRQDPSRTSDTSSVLRPVGSTNRKNGFAKPVTCLHHAEPIELQTFIDALEAAAKKGNVVATTLQIPKAFQGLNDEFMSGVEGPESSLHLVAEKCAQVKLVRDTQGNVDEPLWYNFLGLGRHTTEGKQVVILQEWSEGHPAYDPAKTFAKIQQHVMGGYGPTTCVKFAADNPSNCIGCKFSGKIVSPIVLGRPEPESIATEEEEAVAPKGFKRDEYGVHFEQDGLWKRFYNYDLSVVSLAYDHTLGYEVANIRHKLPHHAEPLAFNIRASLVHDPKALLMSLADNHVQTLGAESRKMMINYIDYSMDAIRAKRKLANLHSQMGWRELDGEMCFVLGDMLYRKDREPEVIGFARNVPDAGRAFKQQGDLEPWVQATTWHGSRGMEPFAFGFLAGAFGAPLMKFTGYSGAMVALVGDSGIGKTLLGEWIMSTYGESSKLVLLKDDTKNFLVQRLGLYGTLPLYVDEISNIDPQELSDLVYKITQGRDKGRLTRSGGERSIINGWTTIAVATSNHSLGDKLALLKSNAGAELNRVLELQANKVPGFGREEATSVYRVFKENYGVAGARYIQYITDTQHLHREKIDAISKQIDEATNAQADERFWSAVAATAIYGGLIASKLGLINFSVLPVLAWVKREIVFMREAKSELITDPTDILGQFLDLHMNNTMVTDNNTNPKQLASVPREPRGQLLCRIDQDTERLYISRQAIKAFLGKTMGSYQRFRKDMEYCGALLEHDKRMVLGRNTYWGGTQQSVWVIDLTAPALGRKTLSIVRSIEAVRRAAL